MNQIHDLAQTEFEALKHTFLTHLEQVINETASPVPKVNMMRIARETVSEVLALVKNDIVYGADRFGKDMKDSYEEEKDDDEAVVLSGFIHYFWEKCGQMLELLKIATAFYKFKLSNVPLPKLSWNGLSDMRQYYDFLITNKLPEEREYIYTYANRRRVVKLSTLLQDHYAMQYFEAQYKIRTSAQWKPGYDAAFAQVGKLQRMKNTVGNTEALWDSVVMDAIAEIEKLNDDNAGN